MRTRQTKHLYQTVSNVRVGKPDVRLTAPSHVRGVSEGNSTGRSARTADLDRVGDLLHANGRRSTGINPSQREPIHPHMPVLTPA